MPVLRNLYEHVQDDLPKAGRQKRRRRAPKPKARKLAKNRRSFPDILQAALKQFYEHYEDEFENRSHSRRGPGTAQLEFEDSPPVFIVVCNNTSVSKEVYKYLAGYETSRRRIGQPPVVPGRLRAVLQLRPATGRAARTGHRRC